MKGRGVLACAASLLLAAAALGQAKSGQTAQKPNPHSAVTQAPRQYTASPLQRTPSRKDSLMGDVLGMHNLSPGGPSPVQASMNGPCTYCHVPHSGNGNLAPLWNQQLSIATYDVYSSTTNINRDNPQSPLGTDSGLCLSCHDGTVAVADTVLYGQLPTTGNWIQGDNFTTHLQSSHPFSIVKPLQDNIDLISSLATTGRTGDPTGAVQLINGTVECTSCHNPHVQGIDKISANFLVRDSASGQMCLACHDPKRTTIGGSNTVNPLAGWAIGIHATANNTVSGQAGLGSYGTVGANACSSCHTSHNAGGPARLLRGTNEADCAGCHSGGSNLSPAAPNIFAEYQKISHPLPNGSNAHDMAEPGVLNNNRHATCVDCHNGHGAQQVTSFNIPPLIRISQTGAEGVSMDGTTLVDPALNQYENCLRCHGTSAGKGTGTGNNPYGYLPQRQAADPLNVIPQMNLSAKSSHPVMHLRSSGLPQPSLLPTMLDFNGNSGGMRAMGSQIFCTDCHNSDDNREFGGTGPAGPHGSKWWHVLERDYEDSQAPGGPGTPITINLNPQPDLSVRGPYGMCAKCHNLSLVMQSTSWAYHNNHVYTDGFSCSTCHNAHGMTATSANPTGVRMVDFDLNVVGQDGSLPIAYDPGSNSCALTCHNVAHDPGGGTHRLTGGPQPGNNPARRH